MTRRTSEPRAAGRSPTRRRRATTAGRYSRGRTPRLSTTVGAALGTFVVSLLLDASWPVRIALAAALVVAVLVVALADRRASARTSGGTASRPSGIPHNPEPQGDSTHE